MSEQASFAEVVEEFRRHILETRIPVGHVSMVMLGLLTLQREAEGILLGEMGHLGLNEEEKMALVNLLFDLAGQALLLVQHLGIRVEERPS